jgi:hypothetical protein
MKKFLRLKGDCRTLSSEKAIMSEQLEKIISDINDGYTSGYGWSIGEPEPEDQ